MKIVLTNMATMISILLISIVSIMGCQKKCPKQEKVVVLQPIHNPFEGHVDSYNNFFATDSAIVTMTWTVYGTPASWRTYLKFDQSAIPVGATIEEAKLYLYGTTMPTGDDGVDNYGTFNSYHVSRVTDPWQPSTINWVQQPTNDLTHRVIVPHTDVPIKNDTIDVTELEKDMQVYGNYGFEMGLEVEQYYNSREYASSWGTSGGESPKLIIKYQY